MAAMLPAQQQAGPGASVPLDESESDSIAAYPCWDPVLRAWRQRCGAPGTTLADLAALVDDQRPDEAAALRWVETYFAEEELDALAAGIATEP